MPGILPMKMIKVGSSNQSRIAQACDRCRSKKIRCDGVRPCCSQCANVGFECKTSDKLSRRAFPRGYTESLEDRVRSLETEVKELKCLLDEKDEKIDMLSRIHNFSSQARRKSSISRSLIDIKDESPRIQEDVILVEIPVAVQPTDCSTGTSTTAALIEAFEAKAQETGRSCPHISSSTLLNTTSVACKASSNIRSQNVVPSPPRLLSDQYITLFFQEWQPLLPVLHRPTFLRTYEQYLHDPEMKSWHNNRQAVAQLFLIFEIAAYSSSSKAKPATIAYEMQWRKALSSISSTPTIATLQSQILAQICYILKADHSHLLRHRAYGVSMVHQLGLHQGHKCHSLPVFEVETRKKVFWCQYVLDKYTSAVTGTPQLLRDSDITTEYPLDVDDENISLQGLSPALPGELTKISSALAFFRLSKILGKTLENLYPSRSSYQLSLSKLHSLSDELDQWQEELPGHLRLRFCNDKPATNLISCRSPLLSMAYFHTRGLIHRPLSCYGSDNSASAATIVLAAAAKHQLQIIDLLDERSMNYTFPVSKQDILLTSGFSVLWQTLSLEADSRLVKDNQKSIALMLSKLSKENQPVCREFSRISNCFIGTSSNRETPVSIDSPISKGFQSSADDKLKSTRKQLQAIASRISPFNGRSKNDDGSRRASAARSDHVPSLSPNFSAGSTVSLSSTRSAPAVTTPISNLPLLNRGFENASAINLDYFPFSDELQNGTNNSSSTMLPPKRASVASSTQHSWQQGLPGIDPHSPDMFSTVSPSSLSKTISNTTSTGSLDWSTELWQMSGFDLIPRQNGPQSLLSFSEESLTSGDDLVFSAPSSHNGSIGTIDTFPSDHAPTIQKAKSTTRSDMVTGDGHFDGITMPNDDFEYTN